MKRYTCVMLSLLLMSVSLLSACNREAKDEGLSVVILDPRDKPGGQLVQGEMLYLDEPSADGGKRCFKVESRISLTATKREIFAKLVNLSTIITIL